MRIIGGKYRGRIIKLGKHFKHRPTTDIAKESLFNILQNQVDFEELHVLDLFAGTGSISLEFASRGSQRVVAVELNFRHYQLIRDTLNELGETNITPVKADAFKYSKKTTESFDVVFADPPYTLENFHEIPDLVFCHNLLKPDGIFILEHAKTHDFSTRKEYIETRQYGSVHFSFFRQK